MFLIFNYYFFCSKISNSHVAYGETQKPQLSGKPMLVERNGDLIWDLRRAVVENVCHNFDLVVFSVSLGPLSAFASFPKIGISK